MAASGFDVYTVHYVRRRIVRLLFLQEEQHFAEKERQAHRQLFQEMAFQQVGNMELRGK